ncbi:MAG TPA: histidinol-phosphate transaminase [Vicinamibacterales bacterium]|nr:histidinol-phosphate transaminase [Vicinamibacterales bacterium]
MSEPVYSRPIAGESVLRLHLNENTSGCSAAALAAVRALSAEDLACYPDYGEAVEAVARAFGVPHDCVLLTNGLDEGILAATAAAFRRRDGVIPEAVGVCPAFDMYQLMTEALGGRMRLAPLDAEFGWTVEAVAACVAPATRIVFVTNPHNPSGNRVSQDQILDLAARVAPAALFVDEAYADFSGETLIDERRLLAYPNIVVGRTFSKAHGLAGLRVGALMAAPETLGPIRSVVPPYSVNAAAVAALPAALSDRGHTMSYVDQSRESREILAGVCRRLGIKAFPSVANFVLIEVGASAPALVRALSERGVAVRDKSRDAGCSGCIRITTGTVADTARLVTALEGAWRELHG